MTSSEKGALAGLAHGSRIDGTFRPPGSKAEAQRALVAAALAHGTTEVRDLPDGDDVAAACALLRAAGIRLDAPGPGVTRVTGAPPPLGPAPRASLRLGESGTLARLAAAALALAGAPGARVRLLPAGTLTRRTSAPLFAALARAGARVEHRGPAGGFDVELWPAPPPERVTLEEPVSSQEASALCLALAAHPGTRTLTVRGPLPSRPYLELTRRCLARFGARIASTAAAGAEVFEVTGPLVAPAAPLALEPDASSAAVLLAAACLGGGELTVPGLGRGAAQGDLAVVQHLRAFGCRARAEADALVAGGAPAHGAELDLAGQPDLAPVLAAVALDVALRRGGTSVFSGLGTLARKESDRLRGLADALARLGARATVEGHALRVAPPERAPAEPFAPLVLDPAGDHRMAFFLALAGLVRPRVLVADPGCVAKSWPGFWDALAALGGRIERRACT